MRVRERTVANDHHHPSLLPHAMIAWAVLCLLAIVWMLLNAFMSF